MYLEPYKPKDEYFSAEVPQEVLQVDLITPEARILSLHYPLLTRFRKIVVDKLKGLFQTENDAKQKVESSDLASSVVDTELAELNSVIRQELELFQKRTGVDLLYFNF